MAEGDDLEQVLEAIGQTAGQGKVKRLRPGQCRNHMRQTLANEFQGIVDGFVKAAKTGSCPHVKLATELLKPVRPGTSRKKGTATLYWEKIEREAKERERLRQEQLDAG